eukprot:TRINITY_DN42315_c0_g1_i1.p1 TRINITY_DN42315_c0_g1~~TRINITY_DN42315_c0_g1_i1.p1  ORF type:complete len:550 (+),score=121.19 TRINITY_DN42315_c0_g1_i1:79-1728(+)
MVSPDDLNQFAELIGLAPEDVGFLWDLPADICAIVFDTFSPDGTKDGNVLGRLHGYVRSVLRRNGVSVPASLTAAASSQQESFHSAAVAQGVDPYAFAEELALPQSCADFLAALPEDLAQSIFRGFDPSGTKDGNVWGRLLGYVRSLWSRRLALTEEAASVVRGLPDDVQMKVIADFDATGSKDGNVSARLMGFARHAAKGSLSEIPVSRPVPLRSALDAARPARGADSSSRVRDFARRHRLDQGAYDFMQQLPDEVKESVVSSFDPSGTKDGNVWGRLFAYIRTVFAKHAGWDRSYTEQLKREPEEEQMSAMLSALGYSHRAPPPASRSRAAAEPARGDWRGFVRHWRLDEVCEDFLQALPYNIQDRVLAEFDGSATKDGNVWGRLLGFVRSTWGRSLGLEQDSLLYIKSMPEDAQMRVIAEFDPSGTKDGNVDGRLMGFAKKAMAMSQARSDRGSGFGEPAPRGGNGHRRAGWQDQGPEPGSIDEFISRCGLDSSAYDLLEPLSEDARQHIMRHFDPRGTKDGNVMGRLEGYIRFVGNRDLKRARMR